MPREFKPFTKTELQMLRERASYWARQEEDGAVKGKWLAFSEACKMAVSIVRNTTRPHVPGQGDP